MTYSERLAKQAASKILKTSNPDDSYHSSQGKVTSKDLRTLKRGINKLQRAKAREKKKNLKRNANMITRALNNVNEAIDKVRRAENNGIDVYTSVNLNWLQDQVLKLYDYYLKDNPGKKMKPKDETRLKEIKKKTYFDDLIFYTIRQADMSDEKSKITAVTKSERQMKKLRKEQAVNPDKLSDPEKELLSKWYDASANGTTIGDISTPEDTQIIFDDTEEGQEAKERFVERFKVTREVSFGGNSQLINALAYTYGAKPSGQKFVEWVQGIMKDPQIWTLLEGAYRSNLNGLQDTIAGAVANEWYGRFKNMKSIIETLVATFKEVQPQALTDEAKELIDEELDDFEDY